MYIKIDDHQFNGSQCSGCPTLFNMGEYNNLPNVHLLTKNDQLSFAIPSYL